MKSITSSTLDKAKVTPDLWLTIIGGSIRIGSATTVTALPSQRAAGEFGSPWGGQSIALGNMERECGFQVREDPYCGDFVLFESSQGGDDLLLARHSSARLGNVPVEPLLVVRRTLREQIAL